MRTATKRAPAASEPTTFAEIAARKMADTVERYRSLAGRAAAGVQLNADELGEVLELLAYMGLPEFAWQRDVDAQRNYTAAAAAKAETDAAAPAAEARLREVVERIKAIEAELQTLRRDQHSLGHVAPMTRVAHMQRMNELQVTHPHMFADVDAAARLRSEAKAKAAGHAMEPAGVEPITTGGWAR